MSQLALEGRDHTRGQELEAPKTKSERTGQDQEVQSLIADVNQKSYEKNNLIDDNNDLKYQLLNLRHGTDPNDPGMYGVTASTFPARMVRNVRRENGLDPPPQSDFGAPQQRPPTPEYVEDLMRALVNPPPPAPSQEGQGQLVPGAVADDASIYPVDEPSPKRDRHEPEVDDNDNDMDQD